VTVTYFAAGGVNVTVAGARGLATTTGRAGVTQPFQVIGARAVASTAGKLGSVFTTGAYNSGIYGTAFFGAGVYGGTVGVPAVTWTGVAVDGGSGLLPQVDWQIDLTPPTDAGHVWTSLSSLVRSCTFTRSGRSEELQRTSPGTLTMVLDNRSDAATSLNIKKAQLIRVLAQWGGVTYPLWWGLVTSAPRQWPSAGKDATVTLQAADILYLMRLFPIAIDTTSAGGGTGNPFPRQRADERIRDICNRISSPTISPLIGTLDSQTDTLDADENTSTSDALSMALAIEASDNGLLIGDPTGTVSYQGRQWRTLNATSSILTFGEGGGTEVPYQDTSTLEDDDTRLANIASVTPLGASTPQVATDSASQALYWTRSNQSVDRSLLSSDTALALAAAQYLVSRYKDPPPRIPALTVNMVTVPSAQKPTVLSLANSQRVTWKRAATTPIATETYVEQIQHTMQPGSSWTMTLQLSPALLETRWILGDATAGKLGTTTALSY